MVLSGAAWWAGAVLMMVGIIVTRKLHQTTRADATSDAIDETMRHDLEPRQGFKCGRTGRKVFPMSEPLQVVNPTTIAELSGRFEPVGSEIEAADLPNKRRLPRDLVGAYLRNGQTRASLRSAATPAPWRATR